MSYKDKHHSETHACALANTRQPSSSASVIQLRFTEIHNTLEKEMAVEEGLSTSSNADYSISNTVVLANTLYAIDRLDE